MWCSTRTAGLVAVLPFAAALAACAPPPPPRAAPSESASSADLGAWVVADEPAPIRTTYVQAAAPLAARGAQTLPVHVAEPPRPRHHGRVDVNLQKADMTSAFQFLADAGRFNLVMQDGLHAQVSATMRGVDPFDALLALADANGVEVRYEREVVLVRKR